MVVTTHSHVDHWAGNAFFSDCEIFGTAATRDKILQTGPPTLEGLGYDAGERALNDV